MGGIWIALGIFKTSFFNEATWFGRWLPMLFFLYGIFLITTGMLLFYSPTPFGAVTNETSTTQNNYSSFNSTDEAGGWQIIPQLDNSTITKTYSYNTAGASFVEVIFVSNMTILILYIILVLIAWLETSLRKAGEKKRGTQD